MKPVERNAENTVELTKAELELIQGGGDQEMGKLGSDIGAGLNSAKGKA